eukprot:CAMPEP_0184235652 /NCGR_PEP_ID=MMETSP0976-20121227/25427_1 /TAXON_ID=483370 /ORGANISM="non described non described, Strain CCMP2097" /LENGTH=35 /DNA_ID= /DNA_START= /DNA_END= /DNA_ORIENTATION=
MGSRVGSHVPYGTLVPRMGWAGAQKPMSLAVAQSS